MIPIYRAKRLDSDEWVEGYLQKLNGKYCFIEECAYGFVRKYIDTSTLSIHFPNILDKNGKKIFASLSEDGVGGDIINYYYPNSKLVKNHIVKMPKFGDFNVLYNAYDIELISIHKGNKND